MWRETCTVLKAFNEKNNNNKSIQCSVEVSDGGEKWVWLNAVRKNEYQCQIEKKKLNIIKFHIINIKWYEELKNNQRTSLKGVTLLIWK